MGWSLLAWPFDESHARDSGFVELLVEAGLDVPVPAKRAPTASDLRNAMRARGCAEPFWPDAQSWFYWADDYEKAPQRVVDGVHLALGCVGGVDVQFERKTGGVNHWGGDWTDELSMFSFDRPDAGAALLFVWEVARRHGPSVVMVEGAVGVALARGDETFGQLYRAAESLFGSE